MNRPPARKRYALIDRDGTLVVEKDYLKQVEELELIPRAAEGLRELEAAGLGRILITNQSAIGRGMLTGAGLEEIHLELGRRLAAEGAGLDAIYHCPHLPEDGCYCRKPAPGLVWRAAAEWEFNPREAFVIGDKPADIDLGRAIGATTILVRTGYGREYERSGLTADFVVDDLLDAARAIRAVARQADGFLIPDAVERLRRHIQDSIETKRKLLECREGEILAAASAITRCLQNGGKLLLCGNGGSAADAQHIAAEFVSVLDRGFQRPGLAAVALTTDASILTASANDFGFEGVFARQVQALARPGDVLIGISTSGSSENVIRALGYARAHGVETIGFTGESGGKVASVAALSIRVPSTSTQLVQESHIMIGHIVCDLVERSVRFPL